MKQVVGDAGRGDDCGDDPGTMCRCANPAHCAIAVDSRNGTAGPPPYNRQRRPKAASSIWLARQNLRSCHCSASPGTVRLARARILSDVPEQSGVPADRANLEPVARLFETCWAPVTSPA